jgi:predicted dehydrogenase
MKRTRYAQVGTGGRARSFYESIASDYTDSAELVGFCDLNQTRMNYANRVLQEQFSYAPVPTYRADAFDRMVAECKPDVVIVTSIDRTHHRYIVRALELGCDAITEKPMTVDAGKCQQILDAVERTGRNLRVTFNYRYSPHASLVRQLLMEGVIGTVTAVHFEWLLDTRHGADYFRRWHRDKRNSGGLLVHLASHHFDLVNFWLASAPLAVAAFGELAFYGRANAEERGETRFYARAHGSDAAAGDPFALDLAGNETLREMYLQAEHEDGYLRDQSVFGDGISIEDTLGLLVRMRNGAMLTYALTAYAPWEGFRLSMTGTAGRIEAHQVETSYVSAGGQQANEAAATTRRLRVLPMFGDPYEVDLEEAPGAHGGADPRILHDLFGERADDPLSRAASHVDGANAILTGIAGNVSMRTGRIVHIADLIDWSPPQ